jgi:hypothetical protein
MRSTRCPFRRCTCRVDPSLWLRLLTSEGRKLFTQASAGPALLPLVYHQPVVRRLRGGGFTKPRRLLSRKSQKLMLIIQGEYRYAFAGSYRAGQKCHENSTTADAQAILGRLFLAYLAYVRYRIKNTTGVE